MKSFQDLYAWQLGLRLVQDVYLLTQKFPREEQYGLTAQLRRASTSILTNLAEGFGRFTYADKAARYTIARGECTEVHAELLIAVAVKFVSQQEVHQTLLLSERVGRTISGLIAATRKHGE